MSGARTGSDVDRVLALERALGRFRAGALAFAVVQTLIEPGDRTDVSWIVIGLLALTAVTAFVATRGRPSAAALRRLGVLVTAADSAVVIGLLGNNLGDPNDVIYLVTLIPVVEVAMRWALPGGLAGGLAAGAAAAAWTAVVLDRAGVPLRSEYLTLRLGMIALLGTFVGLIVSQLHRERRVSQHTLEISRDLIVSLMPDGTIVRVNPASTALLGYAPDELLGRRYDEFLLDTGGDDFGTLAAGGDAPLSARPVRHADGHVVWIELNVTADHAEGLVYAVGRDVTARLADERRLAESEQRFKSLFEQNPDAVFTLDLDGGYVAANAACSRITGYGADELLALRFTDVLHPADLDRVLAYFALVSGGEAQSFEMVIRHRRGHDVPLHITSAPVVVGGEVVGVFGIAKDITDRRRLEVALAHQASHDALTGLANRTLLTDRLDAVLEEDAPPALLFVDLDGFKQVNDSLGHHCGDELLRQVAARIAGVVRPADTVARFGGDEFCVLLPGADGDVPDRIATRIEAVLREPFAVSGHVVSITASVGVGRAETGDTPDEMLRKADAAMYVAKARTRH